MDSFPISTSTSTIPIIIARKGIFDGRGTNCRLKRYRYPFGLTIEISESNNVVSSSVVDIALTKLKDANIKTVKAKKLANFILII